MKISLFSLEKDIMSFIVAHLKGVSLSLDQLNPVDSLDRLGMRG